LLNYKIEVERVTAVVGPTVTLYKVVPAPGVRVAAIENIHGAPVVFDRCAYSSREMLEIRAAVNEMIARAVAD
jgi:hypothetical protein